MRASGATLRAAILLAATTALGSCTWLDPQWSDCRKASSTPMRLGVEILAEQAGSRKAVAGIAVYEGGWISLVHRGSPRIARCQRLSQEELETWIDRLEVLASRMGTLSRREAPGELIAVVSATETSEMWDSVADLSPEALEAARAVACLALDTFGDAANRTIHGAGPRLTARLRFPETCNLTRSGP